MSPARIFMTLELVFETDTEDDPEKDIYAWREWKDNLCVRNIMFVDVAEIEVL